MCSLPQSPGVSPRGCAEELTRCVEELGFVGCNLNPDPSGGYWTDPPLGDEWWYPLYEKLQSLDAPAMIHASATCNPAFHAVGIPLLERRQHGVPAADGLIRVFQNSGNPCGEGRGADLFPGRLCTLRAHPGGGALGKSFNPSYGERRAGAQGGGNGSVGVGGGERLIYGGEMLGGGKATTPTGGVV